jgi:hypothetical protein
MALALANDISARKISRREVAGGPAQDLRAARSKSPVWSTEAMYLLGSTAGVPGGRSAALICAGAPV